MNDLLFDYAQLAQWQQGDEDNSRRLRRLRRRLPDAMAELTPRQRQMVDMQFQEECIVTEIARRLGVNKSTVSRLSAAGKAAAVQPPAVLPSEVGQPRQAGGDIL